MNYYLLKMTYTLHGISEETTMLVKAATENEACEKLEESIRDDYSQNAVDEVYFESLTLG